MGQTWIRKLVVHGPIENWLFNTRLGIVAIFQQVIMASLGALYVTPFLECGSSVALELETNERSQNCCFFAHQVRKNLEMVGPQRRILIFTTLLPSLVAGYCHWEPSVFHRTGIKYTYNYFKSGEFDCSK